MCQQEPNQACSGTLCEAAHLRTLLPKDRWLCHPSGQTLLSLRCLLQGRVAWGSPGHCSGAGGIQSLHIPWAVSCLTLTHAKGTQRHRRGAAGHPCQSHSSLPSCGSLPCTGTGLWGASPGNCSRLKITPFFRNSLTLAAFARLDLSAKFQCQCWHEARGTIIFGKGACFKCLHATLRKLSAPEVTASTGDAFLPQQGCEQP